MPKWFRMIPPLVKELTRLISHVTLLIGALVPLLKVIFEKGR